MRCPKRQGVYLMGKGEIKMINKDLMRHVRDFGDKMYNQLVKHEDKGDSTIGSSQSTSQVESEERFVSGWAGCTAMYLKRRLYENMSLLSVAIERQAPVEYVERKAANVANYATMIADNYRREHCSSDVHGQVDLKRNRTRKEHTE